MPGISSRLFLSLIISFMVSLPAPYQLCGGTLGVGYARCRCWCARLSCAAAAAGRYDSSISAHHERQPTCCLSWRLLAVGPDECRWSGSGNSWARKLVFCNLCPPHAIVALPLLCSALLCSTSSALCIPCLALQSPCPVLPPVLSCPILSFPVLPCHTCPVCPPLPCPLVLPCPACRRGSSSSSNSSSI
jgi:hypothetical protein